MRGLDDDVTYLQTDRHSLLSLRISYLAAERKIFSQTLIWICPNISVDDLVYLDLCQCFDLPQLLCTSLPPPGLSLVSIDHVIPYCPLIGQWAPLLASDWLVWSPLMPGVGSPGIQHPWPHEAGDIQASLSHVTTQGARELTANHRPVLRSRDQYYPIRGPSCVRQQAAWAQWLMSSSGYTVCLNIAMLLCSHDAHYVRHFIWATFCFLDLLPPVWSVAAPGALLTMGLIPGNNILLTSQCSPASVRHFPRPGATLCMLILQW